MSAAALPFAAQPERKVPARHVLAFIFMVFGMFNLRPAQQRFANTCAVVWMAAVMAAMAWLHPDRFPPQVELIQFLMLACVLPVVSVLGSQLTSIHNRLNAQKHELSVALERIQHDVLAQLKRVKPDATFAAGH